jgi:hypothetical protein
MHVFPGLLCFAHGLALPKKFFMIVYFVVGYGFFALALRFNWILVSVYSTFQRKAVWGSRYESAAYFSVYNASGKVFVSGLHLLACRG